MLTHVDRLNADLLAFATTRYNLRVRAPTLGARLARHGITVNAVMPGLVRTPLIERESVVYNPAALAAMAVSLRRRSALSS